MLLTDTFLHITRLTRDRAAISIAFSEVLQKHVFVTRSGRRDSVISTVIFFLKIVLFMVEFEKA